MNGRLNIIKVWTFVYWSMVLLYIHVAGIPLFPQFCFEASQRRNIYIHDKTRRCIFPDAGRHWSKLFTLFIHIDGGNSSKCTEFWMFIEAASRKTTGSGFVETWITWWTGLFNFRTSNPICVLMFQYIDSIYGYSALGRREKVSVSGIMNAKCIK